MLDNKPAEASKSVSRYLSAMQSANAKPVSSQDRPILQAGDFVKASLDGEVFVVSVKERIGNYAVLSNGVKFHVLDDRRKSKEIWLHEPTGFAISLIQEK